MTTAAVVKFMRQSSKDEALRQQLEALLGVGDGKISEAELDEAEVEALKGERAPQVVEFAAQNGFKFSVNEMNRVVDAIQKHHTGELSDGDLAALVGANAAGEVKRDKNSFVNQTFTKLIRYLGKTYLGIPPTQES
jgi:hypothetical protein